MWVEEKGKLHLQHTIREISTSGWLVVSRKRQAFQEEKSKIDLGNEASLITPSLSSATGDGKNMLLPLLLPLLRGEISKRFVEGEKMSPNALSLCNLGLSLRKDRFERPKSS
jgi:hypothetical protein